jgi:hypothetical protein
MLAPACHQYFIGIHSRNRIVEQRRSKYAYSRPHNRSGVPLFRYIRASRSCAAHLRRNGSKAARMDRPRKVRFPRLEYRSLARRYMYGEQCRSAAREGRTRVLMSPNVSFNSFGIRLRRADPGSSASMSAVCLPSQKYTYQHRTASDCRMIRLLWVWEIGTPNREQCTLKVSHGVLSKPVRRAVEMIPCGCGSKLVTRL